MLVFCIKIKIMDDDHYDTLCTFANIPYTPAWYYKRFPGFFNVECYKILAEWEGGVPLQEEVSTDDIVLEDVKENKKRKYTSENSEEEEES